MCYQLLTRYEIISNLIEHQRKNFHTYFIHELI